VAAKTKMGFSSFKQKMGREKGKEAKTILILRVRFITSKQFSHTLLCLECIRSLFLRGLRTGVRFQ